MRRFCREYGRDLNSTQAAIRAGYSPKTAYSIGARLLKNVEVSTSIGVGEKARLARMEVTAHRVLEELARIAFSDPRAIFRDGKLQPPSAWSDEDAASISSIEVSQKYGVQVLRWSKTEALAILAKHFRLMPDRLEASITVENPGADWLSRMPEPKLRRLQALTRGALVGVLTAAQEAELRVLNDEAHHGPREHRAVESPALLLVSGRHGRSMAER